MYARCPGIVNICVLIANTGETQSGEFP